MKKRIEPGMAYNMEKLNKVFAFLAVVFLITVFWVFLDDYTRPWKKYQLEALQIKQEKISENVRKAEAEIDQAKLTEINSQIKEGEALASKRKKSIKAVEEKLRINKRDMTDETIVNGQLNAKIGEVNFNYEIAHSHHDKKADKLFRELRRLKSEFAASKNRLKKLMFSSKVYKKELEALKAELIEAEKQKRDLTIKAEFLNKSLDTTKVTPVFVLRNLPLIDFLDPTLKIQQTVLKNITDDRFFQQVPKVDRCITCHTFIDQSGYEDQPNPHKTHPNLAAYVGKKSPHPMKEVGCTICHGGEGHRVNDFNSAAHTPRDEKQRADWVEKYNWHEPHKVPQPMLRVGQTEASCVKCHTETEFVGGAKIYNAGVRGMEKYGCYGCHKMDGWEHKRPVGPPLNKVSSKFSKEWFKNWVWAPKSFNEHARMPQFFAQTNNSKPEFMKKNIAEVNAIAEFIYENDKGYKPFATHKSGNLERGKELIKEVGCMSCHGVEGYEQESRAIGANAAPYLSGTGSKVNKDWLVSWLLKPSHYNPKTIMPSFRLTKSEADDIATYLLSLKNKKFEKLKFEELDKKTRDEILLTYLSAFDTMSKAKEKLMAMSDHERTMDLGKRSIGKYGCYSCHNIDGFEGRAPIGPELTKIGSKPLTQFGFGHEDVEHSRDSWIEAHLINPRRWDNGVDKAFADLTRMPNFYMTEKEAKEITVALLGRVSDYIPSKGVRQLSAEEKIANDGMKMVNYYNCQGCHKIDGWRGDITAMYEDDLNEGPPYLVGEGHRIQAEWLHYFLGNVHKIRPWLNVRMPSYNLSNDHKNIIAQGFQAKAEQKTFENNFEEVKWEKGERKAALALFEDYACTSCHAGGFTNDEQLAPNLYHAKKRLRGSWIKKWLKNPMSIIPYTNMPNFWEDGVAQNQEILGGDPEKQINALTKYILEIGQNKFAKPWERKEWVTR
jgi:cytochrome c2